MNGQDQRFLNKFTADFIRNLATLETKVGGLEEDIHEIKNNHLKHLNGRITGLYFTVIGCFLLMMGSIIVVGIRAIIGG